MEKLAYHYGRQRVLDMFPGATPPVMWDRRSEQARKEWKRVQELKALSAQCYDERGWLIIDEHVAGIMRERSRHLKAGAPKPRMRERGAPVIGEQRAPDDPEGRDGHPGAAEQPVELACVGAGQAPAVCPWDGEEGEPGGHA